MPLIATPKTFTYTTTLDHVIARTGVARSGAKPELRVASPPEFKGEKDVWTPEDLFVSSIEVCLMLTFIGVAEKRALEFIRYESSAEGTLEWIDGSYRFTRVVVRPRVTVASVEAIAVAYEVIGRAHATCLVANSVRSDVIVKPEVVPEES